MSSQKWKCDGVPKNNNPLYVPSSHPECENDGAFCPICGLPPEAMIPGKTNPNATVTIKTIPSPNPTVVSHPKKSPALVICLIILLLVGAGGALGWVITRAKNGQPEDNDHNGGGIVQVNNSSLISQGEDILILDNTPNLTQKQDGARAFGQSDWDLAMANYEQAVSQYPNDPEAKIYLNNTEAQKQGNPLTIAVVVPIGFNVNEAKEILRGVASAQDDFNLSATGRLLQVMIVNDDQSGKTVSLAEDLINSSDILAVLGHGAGGESRQAIARYENAPLAVLSPISVNVIDRNGQSILKRISITQPEQELLENYLQTMSKTLATYTAKEHSQPSVAIFYNSDNVGSDTIRKEFTNALTAKNGQVVLETDVTNPNFNPTDAINEARQKGANTVLFALSNDQENQAIAIAQEIEKGDPLTLIGSSQLYTPTILTDGGDAIKGLVLGVPWSWQENDPFASQAEKLWKGRVSWRTTTARDVTQALANAIAQNPTREGIIEQLDQGIPIADTAIGVNILDETPLVKAVPGNKGPSGSKYQFDPL
jgi:branched-chain amino acid transport system substrate-binding protein